MKPSSKKNPEHSTMEDSVKIVNAVNMLKPNTQIQYHLVYFDHSMLIALFRNDLSKGKTTELPEYVFKISNILKINFRIPQKPHDMTLDFMYTGANLVLQFKDENFKLRFGTLIGKKIKQEGSLDKILDPTAEYSDVELKYKIAKIMETKNFDIHKENYDHRKIFKISFLKKFDRIYEVESEDYKYLYNRFFIGKFAIVTKQRKFIRN